MNLASKLFLPAVCLMWAGITLNTVVPEITQDHLRPWLLQQNWMTGEGPKVFDQTFAGMDFRRNQARDLVGIIRMRAFDQLRHGAVVGEDGWLFNSDDLQVPHDVGPAVADAKALVDVANEQLVAHGSRLVVLLLPMKSEMEAEWLGNETVSSRARQARLAFKGALQSSGIEVVDPYEPMLIAKADGAVSHKTDQHWNVWGASVAARAVAAAVSMPKTEMVMLQHGAVETFAGDLGGAIGHSAAAEAAGFLTEVVRPVVTVDSSGAEISVDSQDADTVLVGTSASDDARWSFPAMLQYEMQAEVANLSESAAGPFYPMRLALEQFSAENSYPDIVIWEITLPSIFKPEHLSGDGWVRMPWL